jgi:Ca2+-binding RTX toxin-like protein
MEVVLRGKLTLLLAALMVLLVALPAMADTIACKVGRTCSGTDRADVLKGSDGQNKMRALAGADRVWGFDGPDVLRGGFDSDVVRGGAGDDSIAGGSGVDFVYGGPAADRINPGMGHDKVFGGLGNDTITTWADKESTDKISCGGGRDTLVRAPDDRVVDGSCEEVRQKRDRR